ncbi:hypothetical protein [Actinoplanes sp. HUAS TT8]|uniref:hypothetical protein n=1 Tax=Actinoplanes sp. HUAS TT8 TaxID=3447453 RepID=UPI003F520A83
MGNSWKSVTYAGAILLLAIGALSGCGGTREPALPSAAEPASAPASVEAVPSATTDAPASTVPAGPFVAVCNYDTIEYFNPADGSQLASQPTAGLRNLYQVTGATDAAGNVGRFSATGSVKPGGFGLFSCGNYSYSATLSSIAGLDAYDNGDTVPATLDLATGTVTDVVAPTDHSGFASTDVITYVAAVYNPRTDDLWSLRVKDDNHIVLSDSVGHTDTTLTYAYGGPSPQPFMGFVNGAEKPIVYTDSGSMSVVGHPAQQVDQADLGYLSTDDLPDTKYSVQRMLRPDGTQPGAAFVAYPPGNGSAELFTLSAPKAAPQQIGTVASARPADAQVLIDDIQVIRYHL